MNKMDIYNRLPIWGQNLACYAEGKKIMKTRFGDDFRRLLEEYESRTTFSYEQMCEVRDAKLRKMIRHCYDTVPYYTNLFHEGGIDPDAIKTLDDLKVLPILNKQTVNDHFEEFLSTAIPRERMVTAHTSGTTGSGFIFKTTQEALCEQWAVWWRYRQAIGIPFGTLSANFGTRFVVPQNQKKPPFWRYNKPCNQIYFSAFHQSDENLKYYIDEIIRSKVTWIHGYPSLIANVANYMIEHNISLNGQIRFVTLGAENLLEHQKQAMVHAFGVVPIQHYGLSEAVANFSENKEGRILVDEDFAAVEFVPSGDYLRIIGTNLCNFAMPLLRYDTKDTACVEETAGGREITSLDGRIEDYIYLPNGRRIGKLDHVFKDTTGLREVQLLQNMDYSITVLAVKNREDVSADIAIADRMFRESFGDSIKITYKFVDSIPKTAGGKIRFILSEVAKQA